MCTTVRRIPARNSSNQVLENDGFDRWWEQGGPGARYGHVMVEDGAGGAILHGGLGNAGLFADVFRWGTGGVWAEVSTLTPQPSTLNPHPYTPNPQP